MVVKKDKPVEKFTFLSNLKPSCNKYGAILITEFIKKLNLVSVFYWHYFTFSGDSRLNVMEIQQGARAIWLTISHRLSLVERFDPKCTYTFEIHTKCAGYENMLKRQSTVEVIVFHTYDRFRYLQEKKYLCTIK